MELHNRVDDGKFLTGGKKTHLHCQRLRKEVVSSDLLINDGTKRQLDGTKRQEMKLDRHVKELLQNRVPDIEIMHIQDIDNNEVEGCLWG